MTIGFAFLISIEWGDRFFPDFSVLLLAVAIAMGEQPGGVQLVDRYASAAFSEEVHMRLLTFPNDVSTNSRRASPPWHPFAASPSAGSPSPENAFFSGRSSSAT